jgi:hypothetical protein
LPEPIIFLCEVTRRDRVALRRREIDREPSNLQPTLDGREKVRGRADILSTLTRLLPWHLARHL